MSDDYRDEDEEMYWMQKYSEEDVSKCGGKNKIAKDVWDLFWIIVGLVSMNAGKSPAFGVVIILWALFAGKLLF